MDLVWHNIKMSSSNTPSPFMVTTSSNYASSFAGWMAFDGVNNNTNACWSANANRGWITFDFGMEYKQKIACVEISARVTTANGAPKDFTIEISNDNLNWTTVKTIVNETGWTSAQSRQYMLTSNYLARYIRINITANNGRERLDIGEIRFAYIPSINKTLILHDGEYKKVTPAIPYSPQVLGDKVGLVPNMTSYTAPSGLAFASSFSTSGREPWRAFNSNNADTTYTWLTPNYKAEGEFLGYIFNNPQKIRAYSIYPVNQDTNAPPGWKFQISSDTTNGTDGTWTTVDTRSNQHLINTAASHYDLSKEVEAKAFRIVFNKPTATVNLWIKQLQVYKRDIISPEIQAEPLKITAVSNTLPTTTQFLEQGIDSLPPLLDRKVTTLDPMAMSDKSEILGTGEIGKVFNKTIDLKKYFDIRSIKVEVKKNG